MYKFNYDNQHYYALGDNIEIPEYPLTVTLQINRKCNLKCIYCSEEKSLDDLSLEDSKRIINNLKGVDRIIISGGEPLLHKNLLDILECCRANFNVVAMATNAVLLSKEMVEKISKYVNYLDITIDGPRRIHNNIRGEYDSVIDGIIRARNYGIEFSIVTVLFENNKDYIRDIAFISDALGAKKLKILCPIPKGRGNNISNLKLSDDELLEIYKDLMKLKDDYGIKTKIVMTNWNLIKEGHAILIHPNGDVVASPVWTHEGCIDIVGNIYENDIKTIWNEYPYRNNHVNKYIEKTMMVY